MAKASNGSRFRRDDPIGAVKEIVPISACDFSRTQLDVRIGSAMLTDRGVHGRAASQSHSFQ